MSEIVIAEKAQLPTLPVSQVLDAVIRAASDPAVDVSKMRELLGLQKELMAMQAEQQFTQAFHRMQMEMPRVKRSGSVEYKGKEAFKFATWENIDAAIRPILQREGFSLSFDSTPRQGDGGGLIVTGTLSHIGGAKRTASIPVPLDTSGGKNNIQGYGSAMAYGKRYTTTSLCNIVTEAEDDDGHRGGERFIEPEQVQELHDLVKQAGRTEADFMQTFSAGTLHHFDELEPGTAYLAAKGALSRMARSKGAP